MFTCGRIVPRLLSQVASKSRTNKRSNLDSLKRLNEQRLREFRATRRATERDHLAADIRRANALHQPLIISNHKV